MPFDGPRRHPGRCHDPAAHGGRPRRIGGTPPGSDLGRPISLPDIIYIIGVPTGTGRATPADPSAPSGSVGPEHTHVPTASLSGRPGQRSQRRVRRDPVGRRPTRSGDVVDQRDPATSPPLGPATRTGTRSGPSGAVRYPDAPRSPRCPCRPLLRHCDGIGRDERCRPARGLPADEVRPAASTGPVRWDSAGRAGWHRRRRRAFGRPDVLHRCRCRGTVATSSTGRRRLGPRSGRRPVGSHTGGPRTCRTRSGPERGRGRRGPWRRRSPGGPDVGARLGCGIGARWSLRSGGLGSCILARGAGVRPPPASRHHAARTAVRTPPPPMVGRRGQRTIGSTTVPTRSAAASSRCS